MKETVKAKKLHVDKWPKDHRSRIVLFWFLKHPEKMREFFRKLWVLNIITHIQDDILQEVCSYAPLMMDQGVNQKMKNANKSMESLLDSMYKQTRDVLKYSDNNYASVVDIALQIAPILDVLVNDITYEGSQSWRMTDLKAKLKDLVPQSYIEEQIKNFILDTEKDYAEEYKMMENLNLNEAQQAIWDAAERILIKQAI